MSLDEFVGKGWDDHPTDAEGVWARLHEGLHLVETGAQMFALANLATHVAGEHLGRWDEGVAFLDLISALPAWSPESDEAKGVRRLQAGLEYCAGRLEEAERKLALAMPASPPHTNSPRVQMLAVAASAMAGQGRTAEAVAALEDAVRLADYGPTAADPAARALAITGNNLACEFENRPTLDGDERNMMLRAAEIGRRYWEISGNWMNVERAEYRLALAHLKAGLAERAQQHAEECLRVVDANGGDEGELFFAHQALAKVKHALGDSVAAKAERDAAAALLPTIEDAGFRSFCQRELPRLDEILAR
jgi:hypothetical protein